jgi:23S rRNA (cytidine2498-2'-O)-methyltransferase
MPPDFLFTVCQAGAEAALKQEVAREHAAFRFAFSRPGFVTFRVPSGAARGGEFRLAATFARTWGFSVGKVIAADQQQSARDFWNALVERFAAERLAQFEHLHTWERDRALPGDFQFEPGVTPAAQAVGDILLEHRPTVEKPWSPLLNEHASADDFVLDCVIVEPNEWWLGWHRASSFETRFPGGVPHVTAPPNMISRAYLKMTEALLWAELPIQRGDRCVEIGSAPGGSCQTLLDRGCIVTGIDPAEMDPRVLANPRFTHVRARAKEVKRSAFRAVRWLTADANVAPKYTLDTVEAIVTYAQTHIEGLLLTLKLTDPALAADLPSFEKRIRSWGYRRVRARQLAFNRQEVCVVATDRQT